MPVLYPVYVLALAVAIARHPRVVGESRGTYAWLRRLVTACARTRGREAVIVLLDAATEDAIAGQKVRGRVAPEPVMRVNTSRWGRLLDAARSGTLAAEEGWSKVVVLDRTEASAVEDLGELTRGATAHPRRGVGFRPIGPADPPPSAKLSASPRMLGPHSHDWHQRRAPIHTTPSGPRVMLRGRSRLRWPG